MKFAVLLRGINVGGNHKVDMKTLKMQIESAGFTHISTYINTGNIIFESELPFEETQQKMKACLEENYSFAIPLLIKTAEEIRTIAEAIPCDWQNDTLHKTDVAYLFPEADMPEIIDNLPIKKEFLDIRYTPGALFWNVEREKYNQSRLNKLVGRAIFKMMTIRNVNTARKLAEMLKK